MNPSIKKFASAIDNHRPAMYYATRREKYYYEDDQRNWISVNETKATRWLKGKGFCPTKDKLTGLSEVDYTLLRIQKEQGVLYAGPMAGYCAGPAQMCDNRILVTTSPRLITPEKGKFPTIQKLLWNMFAPDGDNTQLNYFLARLKLNYEKLTSGSTKTAQAVAICGDKNAGKTAIIELILTPLFGGRAAKPMQALKGDTPFNGDWLAAEHLVIDDESGEMNPRKRPMMGNAIKTIVANRTHRIHSKGQDAFTAQPTWFLTLVVNADHESLMALPPITDSLEDKIMLFRAYAAAMPMPTDTPEQEKAFADTIQSELPAFVYFLQNMDIPDDMRCSRYGVRTYHHPEVAEILFEQSPEAKLMECIKLYCCKNYRNSSSIEVSASDLERYLTDDDSPVRQQVTNILCWQNACGSYLGRLAKKHPDKFEKNRTTDARMWKITFWWLKET